MMMMAMDGVNMLVRTPIIHPNPVLLNLRVPNRDYYLNPMSLKELSKNVNTIRPPIHPNPVLLNLRVPNRDCYLNSCPSRN